jgi:hypothetical protein
MESYDLSHLPPPVHDAVLHVLETLVQAFPVATSEAVQVAGPSAGGLERFPRGALELLVLEALEALAPMSASPLQVATMIHRPHLEVRNTLQALAMLGTIGHPHRGYYARYALPADYVPRSAGSAAQKNDSTPSTRFAPQIAALCTPSTPREHTKE